MKRLITNNKTDNFYNLLIELFSTCKSFYINVAFINYSGLQLLLDSLKKCEKKDIKAKVLTSTYLNFTEVKALKKLQEFKNIDLKIFDSNDVGFHSKAYIFEYDDCYKIIIGSSNITASAFKTNIEWNLKVISKKDDEFVIDVLKEYDLLFKKAYYVDEKFLNSYEDFITQNSAKINQSFIFKQNIEPNIMQSFALNNLKDLRLNNENKALAICATGTGKTYLSAFDVKEFAANKMLFLAHRENILISAKFSFEKIIDNKKLGFFTGNKKELESDYIFATIQTISKNLNLFKSDEFDYIVYDEAHHISSQSFQKVYKYFNAKFSLGLTATPNRSDNQNIFELFDDNLAIDLRLSEALEQKLIAPFHYFGISDIVTDYKGVNLDNIAQLSKLLSVNKRVDFIIEKLKFYGHDKGKRKVLAFCINKQHANYMCEEFNKKGIYSTTLLGEDSISNREVAIKKLEDENDGLEVIFSVDIFNEGIDIPKVNTILMLRPTTSSTIFIQQLGRGLRKTKDKEFLTVLDFIGNHNRAYLVAFALLGNRVIDKDSIKLALNNSFAMISNNTFIYMDEISKQRILKQLDEENFSSFRYLKEQFIDFKNSINKIPTLVDFITYETIINPKDFIDESKSYIEFVLKVLKQKCEFSSEFIKVIRFIDSHIKLKRVHEFAILSYLLNHDFVDLNIAKEQILKYQEKVDLNTVKHSFRYLNQEFFDSAQINRQEKIVNLNDDILEVTNVFKNILKNEQQKKIIKSSIEYAILLYEKEFNRTYYSIPFFKLYEKYNMKNIALLCNLDKIHSSFRGSGQLKFKNDYFLFINLDKQNAPKSKRYNNTFFSRDTFSWQTKPNATIEKGDGKILIANQKHKVRLHIFVRKFIKVDNKTQNFIYLGLANTIKYENEKPINLTLKLEKELPTYLYDEFTLNI
ncbi:DNA repair helicase [Malaciobacter molluscorum]|uniref:DEAD/DEAH box helicase n=1 Tax=Malaciobacter molluscorum TaxID=1032072 RepID=UPI00100AF0D2|nr:DEAD/DEAH box helicase [Malaciobacter molluscorum]RXJ93812.1 DNA repair helicase [Malaciobacter molluscorum]